MLGNAFERLKNKKYILLLIFGLILGILLILLGNTSSNANKTNLQTKEKNNEYAYQLEERLEEMINNINGVSNAKVLVTLKSSCEYVFASDNSSTSEKHVIVEDGLVQVKEYMPEIEGVAVVCTGGNDTVIQSKITDLLCSVLGIYSTHVYITE